MTPSPFVATNALSAQMFSRNFRLQSIKLGYQRKFSTRVISGVLIRVPRSQPIHPAIHYRLMSTKDEKTNGVNETNGHHEHAHSHSNHQHSHSHEDGIHSHGADQIIAALQGKGAASFLSHFRSHMKLSGDRGSYITLVGLYSNIGLTLSKGFAGFSMNSASLIADAAHSLSGTHTCQSF